MRTKNALLALAATFALTASLGSDAVAQGKSPRNQPNRIQRVLLVSIDGMHAVDYINCSQGVSGVNNGQPYCPNLAALGATGINYLDTSTSKPSDSFPGLTTIISGATPRLHGAFYDVAYDRDLAPPLRITGNGLKADLCFPTNPTVTRPDRRRASTETRSSGMALMGSVRRTATAASTRLIRANCRASPTTTALPSTRGIS